jgi:hypothetical protein
VSRHSSELTSEAPSSVSKTGGSPRSTLEGIGDGGSMAPPKYSKVGAVWSTLEPFGAILEGGSPKGSTLLPHCLHSHFAPREEQGQTELKILHFSFVNRDRKHVLELVGCSVYRHCRPHTHNLARLDHELIPLHPHIRVAQQRQSVQRTIRSVPKRVI